MFIDKLPKNEGKRLTWKEIAIYTGIAAAAALGAWLVWFGAVAFLLFGEAAGIPL